MSNSNIPMFTQAVKTAGTVLSAASAWTPSNTVSTNLVTLLTAGSNGARVTSLVLSSTDSVTRDVFLVLDVGGAGTNFVILGIVDVLTTSGTVANILAVDALNSTVTVGMPIDNNGKRIIQLGASDKLWIGVAASMTALKIILAAAQYENY